MTQLDETVAINVLPADHGAPAGKLADVELHFTAGALEGLKLLGFTVWEGRGDKGQSVSLPSRHYMVDGERRSFMLLVPLRDRCSFGRFTWLISQALTVTHVVGEHRLYLERNCRLPESGPQETAESRGACQFQGAEQSAGFGPAVEPRRK